MDESLWIVTCGGSNVGKSTLVGRLQESLQLFDDETQLTLRDFMPWDSRAVDMELALANHGQQVKVKSCIASDPACRCFATLKRRFILFDEPGDEQYTLKLAKVASTADLALLVVDANRGPHAESYRQARIAAMFGIRHLVVAVNKMDEGGWKDSVFAQINHLAKELAESLGFLTFKSIPVSALRGDNIGELSARAPWYEGPTLINYLEDIDTRRHEENEPFRMAVRRVNRHGSTFHAICGYVLSGGIRVGDGVRIVPAGRESRVRSIHLSDNERAYSTVRESVTICLEDELDVSRGCVIASTSDPPEASDQFEAKVLSLSKQPLLAGRSYLFHLHCCQANATITAIKSKIDPHSGSQLATHALRENDIGVINFSLDRAVPFDTYEHQSRLGNFILVDRLSKQPVGAGMIQFSLRRAANIHWQALDVNKAARAQQKIQDPICLWFTGLSGSGKSTIANLLEKRLFAAGRHTYTLDGDNIRHGLNRDLGFSEADRVENIRRVTEVARLLVDAGLVVIVSFISPFSAERGFARTRFAPEEFLEIFVDTPIEECERRDPKGLYAKARRGELVNFTGIDSPYEPPASAEVHLETLRYSAEECVEFLLQEWGKRSPYPIIERRWKQLR